jgi:hypothetical protein
MEITWSLYDCEGHESVAVALSHRYRQVVGEVREKIGSGEEKILPVLTAGAKMELFMSHFDDYGADVKDLREDLYFHLGCEFDLPPEAINSALQQVQQIIDLHKQVADRYR